MPNGKYDSGLRKARYAELRQLGVSRNQALLVRDWSLVSYRIFLYQVRTRELRREFIKESS